MWPLFSLMSDCEAYSRQLGVTAGTEGVSLLSPPIVPSVLNILD